MHQKNLDFVKELIEMNMDIIEGDNLITSLADVQYEISKPYDENGETYATLTVMQESGDVKLIAKIKIYTSKSKESTEMR